MLRDLFKRAPVHIELSAAVVRDVRAGDAVLIGLPANWTPELLTQFVALADEAFKPRLPEGVHLIFVPTAQPFQVLRSSAGKPKAQKDAGDG